MNFDVTVNGKPWKVAIAPGAKAGRYGVIVKGERREVDAAWIDADTLSLIDVGTGVAHEVGLTGGGGSVDIAVGGRTFRTIAEQRKRDREPVFAAPVEKAPGPFSSGRVLAPMPGRLVRVLVAPGDKVTIRQAVVVVEAMKMENELRAPVDGTVTEVLVKEGTAVEAGAVLVVIE